MFLKLVVIANLVLSINSLCDNVKSVCDCQQSTINSATVRCPKMYVGGQYTHHLEIIDNQHVKIDCIQFNPLNKIPEVYSEPHLNVKRVDFINCFNNDLRHSNYQVKFVAFMRKILGDDGQNWNSIDIRFQTAGKVNETQFFNLWPPFISQVKIENIYMKSSAVLPHLYNVKDLSLINVNSVDFDKFASDSVEMKTLEITNTKSVVNLNKRNMGKFKQLLWLTIENSRIDDYYGNIYSQGSIFEQMADIEDIALVSTFSDYTETIQLNSIIFNHLNRLKSLKLVNLKLVELPPKIFNDLVNLNYLELKHNRLSGLNKNEFANCQNLVKIDLSHNYLVRLDTTMFSNLPRLTVLIISHNELKSFMYDASHHDSFKEIYLDHNQIQMDSFTCPIINIFHSGGVIDYSYNLIARSEPIIDCLIQNPELQEFRVTNNQIESLRVLKLVSNQTMHKRSVVLRLENNLIDYIDLFEAQYEPGNKDARLTINIHLDSNPIFCTNCQYINTLFMNGSHASWVQYDTAFHIPQPEYCLRTIYCPIDDFVADYPCPDPCHCTYNKFYGSLSINCEKTGLTKIPFLSDDLLHGIIVTDIQLNLQDNHITDISFDKLVPGNQTSFDILHKIKHINLEHNSIETLQTRNDHFPIALETLKLAGNQIWHIDEATLQFMNLRASRLSVSLGNNTITRDDKLYESYSNRIKFVLIDRQAIADDINSLKLEARIRDSQSNTVSLIVVSVVFVFVMFGLSFIGYVFHKHSKMELIQLEKWESKVVVSESVADTCNDT